MTNGIVSTGYQGRDIDDVVKALSCAGVGTVADVRLNAISRKRGFSKSRLRAALSSAGIEYVHMRSLGNGKDNREPFHTGDVERGRAVYRSTLDTPEAQASLTELADLADEQIVAVMCFEADHDSCHRQVIIEEVGNRRCHPLEMLTA